MPAELAEASATCPKHMTYGPCGGVRGDGSCEIDAALACPFVPLETVRWQGPAVESTDSTGPAGAADRLRTTMTARPIVVADFPARALDVDSLVACADALRGSVDAVLAGDAGSARVQFPPATRARLILESGVLPWSGVNCRDRNRVALEGELAALAAVGTAAVHCVTGDHTHTGSRPDAAPVFDLDSTRLAALARDAGHLVSVAETPVAPPTSRRPERLLEKQRAGAEIAFVNHSGGVEAVADFIARCRAIGVSVGFIPCVPIILDEASAAMIRSFTALSVGPGHIEAILGSDDPREAGIVAATALATRMLEIDGVVGVNLSGGPSEPGAELDFARALADIGARIAEATAARTS